MRGPSDHGPEVSISIRLAAVAIVVLLMACANVASLLIADSMRRTKELAVRIAVGASRAGLTRMFLAESILLALLGGIFALLVTNWSGGLLRNLLFPNVNWARPPLDWRAGLFTMVLTLTAAFVAGLLLTWNAIRGGIAQSLRSAGPGASNRSSRLRQILIVVQVALTMLLLVGAAVFARSLSALRGVDLGFDVERLAFVTVQFPPGESQPGGPAMDTRLAALASRIASYPGVEHVALASAVPMHGFSFAQVYYANGDSVPSGPGVAPAITGVSPDYFAATGIRMLKGRAFTAADGLTGSTIVSQALARSAWPRGDPLGQCLRLGRRDAPCLTVIGVAQDAHRAELVEDPVRQSYVALSGLYSPRCVIVRARPDRLDGLQKTTREVATTIFPHGALHIVRMSDMLDPQYRPWRLGTILFATLGLLAVTIAAAGISSTVSQDVIRLRHELGIRVALGAQRSRIAVLVLSKSLRVVAAGLLLGALAAVVSTRFVASLLYGVSSTDPVVFGLAAFGMLLVALAASAAPTWRAVHSEPMQALRAE